MAQINYVSRNQLHCTANLNFGLMCKKTKHCWALSTNFLILFSWQFFLIMFCFLLNWRKNSNYFKVAVCKVTPWNGTSWDLPLNVSIYVSLCLILNNQWCLPLLRHLFFKNYLVSLIKKSQSTFSPIPRITMNIKSQMKRPKLTLLTKKVEKTTL